MFAICIRVVIINERNDNCWIGRHLYGCSTTYLVECFVELLKRFFSLRFGYVPKIMLDTALHFFDWRWWGCIPGWIAGYFACFAYSLLTSLLVWMFVGLPLFWLAALLGWYYWSWLLWRINRYTPWKINMELLDSNSLWLCSMLIKPL